MIRDLNKEAYLWYTTTSPEHLQIAHDLLYGAAKYLRSRVEQHEFAMQYPPITRWLGVMEHLVEIFPNAKAMLINGDYSAMLEWAGRLKDIPRGFAECEMGWLPREDEREFMSRLDSAYTVCSRFVRALTMSQHFLSDLLLSGETDWRDLYDEDQGFAGNSILALDDLITNHPRPEYVIDTSVACRTGEVAPWTGVWVPAPDIELAALAFVRQGQMMQPAYEVTERPGGHNVTRPAETAWHPVRPTGHLLPLQGMASHDPLRIPAGKNATQSGYWFTPAKQNSRRYFKLGDALPEIESSSYGATFWQLSPDQSDPSLR